MTGAQVRAERALGKMRSALAEIEERTLEEDGDLSPFERWARALRMGIRVIEEGKKEPAETQWPGCPAKEGES